MAEKPTYDELVQHIRAFELNAADRLQAERRLRKSEQRYRRLFANAAFFISVFGENGRCLMMNQNMAHLHGGHPEDYQGKSIYLPASEKPVARVAAMTPTIRQGAETILLIDDEAMIIEVAQAMLEKLGYAVISANSGNAAIDVIERFKDIVNLVILDLVMPGLDGSRTYARIRQIAPTMRVLLSSGYALDGQAEALLRKGCRGFIQKPITIQDLSVKIRDVLDRAE
jgi:CheY-like chemotaxis protein